MSSLDVWVQDFKGINPLYILNFKKSKKIKSFYQISNVHVHVCPLLQPNYLDYEQQNPNEH